MFLGRVLPSPFDITLAFACSDVPPHGQNEARYCNPEFDRIALQYDRTSNTAVRAMLLSRALHLIDEDAVVIVTVGQEDLFGVNNAVKGFVPNAATPFDDMLRVDVVPQ
jgi:ABC-type transport system substrate-binding protein